MAETKLKFIIGEAQSRNLQNLNLEIRIVFWHDSNFHAKHGFQIRICPSTAGYIGNRQRMSIFCRYCDS